MADRLVDALDGLKSHYGEDAARRKIDVLAALGKKRLARTADVAKLHEALCFLRAYPDNAEVLDGVERLLAAFGSRADVRKHRAALADSGIAGTTIHFAFFPATAVWLARRWGAHLTIDWSLFEGKAKLERLLPELALYGETPGLDNFSFSLRQWIDRFKGPDETDAQFVLQRLAQLPGTSHAFESLLVDMDIPFVLAPGPDTPARTNEKYEDAPIAFQSRPLDRSRPVLRKTIIRPPLAVRSLSPRQAARMLVLARSTMATRSRDLDAFAYGEPGDVTLVDAGSGLELACIGVRPDRRFLLESIHGFLMLKNGVPVGYGSYLGLLRSVEVAFTVLDTFRAGEAAGMYDRALATARHLYGHDTFCVDPYQLGRDNEDGIRSGAWWFYQKMGFRPRDAGMVRIMNKELKRMRARPRHRTSAATLRTLATENVFLDLKKPRDDVIGILPLENIGLAVTRYVADRFGHDRRRAERTCAREAAALLGVRSFAGFSAGERLAWRRWGPVVCILPGVERWSRAEKRDLTLVVRAKGGKREADYLRRFDAHRRLRRAVRALSLRGDDP